MFSFFANTVQKNDVRIFCVEKYVKQGIQFYLWRHAVLPPVQLPNRVSNSKAQESPPPNLISNQLYYVS